MKLFSAFIDLLLITKDQKGINLWPEFERDLIEQEIKENRHWKITEGKNIACIFSVVYDDPIIWEEKNKEPSVYLHRITTDPAFKGKGMMQLIIDWAKEHAKQKNLKFIRMDTWGDNESLKKYYLDCGFTYLGKKKLPEINSLPQHYWWGTVLSLFEIKI